MYFIIKFKYVEELKTILTANQHAHFESSVGKFQITLINVAHEHSTLCVYQPNAYSTIVNQAQFVTRPHSCHTERNAIYITFGRDLGFRLKMATVPLMKFENGNTCPVIGLGTWKVSTFYLFFIYILFFMWQGIFLFHNVATYYLNIIYLPTWIIMLQ